MAQFFTRQPEASDNEELCRLSQVPMQGHIALALERLPDYFAACRVQNNDSELVMVCDRKNRDRIAAIAGLGRRRVFVDGEECWVRYLSDLRILPEYRGLRPLRLLNDYFISAEDETPSRTMQTIIFSENRAFRDIVDRPNAVRRRLKFLWYYPLGDYRTSAVSLQSGKRRYVSQMKIRKASSVDITQMQAFFDEQAAAKQFYPAYRFDRLEDPYYRDIDINDYYLAFDANQLVGITGTWDQRAFKQTRVVSYSGALKWTRPIANLLSRSISGFTIPPAGNELASFYLHTIVTRNNSPDIFRGLLEHIYSEYREGEYAYFLCGLFANDPLVEAVNAFRNRRDMAGSHYEVGAYEIEQPLPQDALMYMEAARI